MKTFDLLQICDKPIITFKQLYYDWLQFARELLWDKPWRLFVLIFAVVAGYGGKLVTLSYNNDNVYEILQSKPLWLFGQHRYGNSLFALLGLQDREIFFWSSWIELGISLIAGLLIIYYFYLTSNKTIKFDALFVQLLCFILYPISMESKVYPVIGGVGHLLVIIALLIISRLKNNSKWLTIVLPVFFIMLAVSGYEVLAIVYLVMVLLTLFLEIYQGDEVIWQTIIKKISVHVLYLGAALLAWGILIFIVKALKCYTPDSSADREILWLMGSKVRHWAIAHLFPNLFGYYVFNSLFYFALLEFWLAVGLAIYFICKRRSKFWLLSGLLFLMICAMFSLSFLQCRVQPYRVCQAMPVFVSFFLMLFYQQHGRKNLLVKILLCFIIFFQTKEMALMTKFERESSEHATFCFKTLGHEIKSAFPDYNKRQVIIVGACQEGRQLSGADTLQPPFLYKCQTLGYYQHIGLHYFYDDSRKQSRKLLEYHTGIIVEDVPDEELQLWRNRVQSERQPAWPAHGYIREIDGNIVVNMGFEKREEQPAFLNRMIDFAKRLLGRD